MKKRILGMVTILCLLLALFPVTVFAYTIEDCSVISCDLTTFTYSDEQVRGNDKGWLNSDITVTVCYGPAHIGGSQWIPNTDIGVTTSYNVVEGTESDVGTLKISGKPNSELENVLLGYIKFKLTTSDGNLSGNWTLGSNASVTIAPDVDGYVTIPIYVNYTHTHSDENKDHVCDEENCKVTLSSHIGGTATCVEKAECDYCGKEYGEFNGDNHVGNIEFRIAKEATCTEPGYTGDIYCKSCGARLATGRAIAAKEHDYKSEVTKEPTSTSLGIRTYSCKNCDYSYTEDIAKLPEEHNHSYVATVTKEADCTNAGIKTYTCSCGDSYTESIPATHSGGTATCKDKAVCDYCGDEYGEVNADNHDFTKQVKNADTLKSAANCQDKALYYYSCSRCGEIEKNNTHTFEGELDSSNHTGILGEWQMDEDKHWKAYTCCTDVTEEKSAHNYVDGKCECGAVKYTVTFDANGGNVDTASATTDIWGKLNTLPTPTHSSDYRFDGWYKAKEGGKKISGSTVFAANTTLYARWTDLEAPTGEITLGTNSWRCFLNSITFGLFFKDTQEVTITATDNSHEDVTIEYLLSNKKLSSDELAKATFTAYTGKINIEPNNEYVIYAKLTDKTGNATYINSNGIVLDNVKPVISGIVDGETYCNEVTFTVFDNSGKYDVMRFAVLQTRDPFGSIIQTPISEMLLPDANGVYALTAFDGTQTIGVCDYAGNKTQITVTVNNGHAGGTADCAHKAVCTSCGEEYGEVNADNHTTLKRIEAKAATVEAEGNIEYWHCEECGKYFSDKDGKNEISLADTVIAKLIKTDSPQTGDNSHMALCFALLFISAVALVGTAVLGRERKHFVK